MEAEGLTTQQWTMLGALSQPTARGVISRVERDGHLRGAPDGDEQARPKIDSDYGRRGRT